VFTGTSRFELRRCLGRGGFGPVYEALDRNRGVRVALKVLHAVDPSAVYRFKREFRTLADIDKVKQEFQISRKKEFWD